MEILREKKESKVKVPKSEEKEIAKHYRQELKKIEQALETEEPPIDFESWQ